MATASLSATGYMADYHTGEDKHSSVLTLRDGSMITREGLHEFTLAVSATALTLSAADWLQGNIYIHFASDAVKTTAGLTVTGPTLTAVVNALPKELRRKGTVITTNIIFRQANSGGGGGFALTFNPDSSMTTGAYAWTQTITSGTGVFNTAAIVAASNVIIASTNDLAATRSLTCRIILVNPDTPTAIVQWKYGDA